MKKFVALIIYSTLLVPGVFIFAQGVTQVDPTLNPTFLNQPTNCPQGVTGVDCYQLLEPIPLASGPVTSIDTTAQGQDSQGLGGFINFMFEIGIGIAGVIAVVMLVIYGFRYAANDKNISEFSNLREKITNVILGLLLLLGTFVILKTINPDLLIVEPAIDVAKLSIDEQGDGTDPGNTITGDQPVSGVKTLACPAGIVTVKGINICKSLATSLDALLTDARLAGANISGGGYRNPSQQMTLRNNNCGCGNNMSCITTKPAKQCTPPTAIPGTSRHESGLAIDFTCNGTTMRKGSVCYTWMTNNASRYGFKNYSAESWHWSIDGH